MIKLLLLLLSLSASAEWQEGSWLYTIDDGDWREDMKLIARGLCADHPSVVEHIDTVNPSLLILACRVGNTYPGEIIVTSGQRISKHHYGNAIDFIIKLADYDDRCSVYKEYTKHYRHLRAVLELQGLTEYVGLGLYPKQRTPFFHLDLRGERARWSRIDEQFFGIGVGEEFVSDRLKECTKENPS